MLGKDLTRHSLLMARLVQGNLGQLLDMVQTKVTSVCFHVSGYFCACSYQFRWETCWPSGWHAGLQIKRSGFEPWLGHCVVFLGKTLYSHSASLHPGV